MRLFAFCAMLLLAVPGHAVEARAAVPQRDFDIIVVAGQSNAVGFGLGTRHDPEENTPIDRQIWQIGPYNPIGMQVVPAKFPLDYPNLHTDGKTLRGFDLPFARRYAHRALLAGRHVLIVPAARDSTSILEWQPDSPNYATEPSLYRQMSARIGYVLAQFPGSRIVAFQWQQGEEDILYASDPTDPHHARMPDSATYRARFERLVGFLRQDFDTAGLIPILVGEPSRQVITAAYDRTRPSFVAAMVAVVAANRCLAFVRSDGLEVNAQAVPGSDDPLHFSAWGQYLLGERRLLSYAGIAQRCLPRGYFR